MLQRRPWIVALLVCCGLTTPAPAAPKKPPPTPEERIATAIAKLRKRVADKHFTHARWLAGRKLKRSAHGHRLLALHFAPESRSIRSSLGYKRGKDGWTLREPVDLAALKDVRALEEAEHVRDDEIRAFRVKELVRIAGFARALELDARAKEIFERAVRIDPDCDEARKALGHRRIGPRWFTPGEAPALPVEVRISRIQGPSSVTEPLNLIQPGWQTGRSFYESRGTDENARVVLEAARRADGLCTLLVDEKTRNAFSNQPINVHDIGDQMKFVDYVNSLRLPPAHAAAAKRAGIVGGFQRRVVLRILANRVEGAADWWAHVVAAFWLRRAAAGQPPAWALSGFTDYVSDRVVGTMQTRFVVAEESAGVRWSAEKPSPRAWRRSLRDLAVLGDDAPSGILFSSSITGLTTADVAKSWSLVSFLVDRDRAAFVRFLAAAAKGDSIEALRKEYGFTPERLDEVWREHVIENG